MIEVSISFLFVNRNYTCTLLVNFIQIVYTAYFMNAKKSTEALAHWSTALKTQINPASCLLFVSSDSVILKRTKPPLAYYRSIIAQYHFCTKITQNLFFPGIGFRRAMAWLRNEQNLKLNKIIIDYGKY